jgi:hypothetical protein
MICIEPSKPIIMRTSNVLLLSVIFFLNTPFLQAQQGRAGIVDAVAGIGLLPTFNKDDGKTRILPLLVGADVQVHQHFKIGLSFGYSLTQVEKVVLVNQPISWESNFSTLGLRLAVNAGRWDDWDVYGGFALHYNRTNITITGQPEPEVIQTIGLTDTDSFSYTGFLGAQYMLMPRLGFFGEVGYNISIATVGVKVRFGKLPKKRRKRSKKRLFNSPCGADCSH